VQQQVLRLVLLQRLRCVDLQITHTHTHTRTHTHEHGFIIFCSRASVALTWRVAVC
jgi:hypothetical protein